MKRILFITGTDTGVGKTVLTALLVKCLHEQGVSAVALKPVCSGGRADARVLHAAMDGALALDEINPWHFRAPIAPLLAAQRENKTVGLVQVLARVRAMQKRSDVLLVEGAGGLLSPLGEGFDSRDLILALRATPLIVAPNRLGVVNQALLTLEALPGYVRRRAKLVFMSPPRPDAATATNASLLAEFFDARRIFTLPWLGNNVPNGKAWKNSQVLQLLHALTECDSKTRGRTHPKRN
ncbi:MAG TPA: dethiobiotin synthase [Verrucomicrobiae bacterium]|nr:dethiobiotin synthase [Verrucomicrobiae bacterium]